MTIIPKPLVIEGAPKIEKPEKDLVISLFGESKLAVVTSLKAREWMRFVEENSLEYELNLGEEVLIEDCQIVFINKEPFYRIKIYGLKLKSDQFGFEKYFPHYWFTQKVSARAVLQGMGVKFNNEGKIIPWKTKN